ncbi:MAG TPA: hypothetical protein VFX70_18550, partial [Mycobacteriales bacterium]|nr:hypothetical protein [Mycobacteriales bacterium]
MCSTTIMRWDHLRLSALGPGLTPTLFGDEEGGGGTGGAVVRTFDTPGFRGVTCYEIRARSVINRVPAASRMPFRWTVSTAVSVGLVDRELWRAVEPGTPRPA